jgi:hypothetical protein
MKIDNPFVYWFSLDYSFHRCAVIRTEIVVPFPPPPLRDTLGTGWQKD